MTKQNAKSEFEKSINFYMIDKLVYQLYNLTDDEIKIVEGE